MANAMNLTKSGRSMLKFVDNSSIGTRMIISPNSKEGDKTFSINGETVQGNFNKDDNYGKVVNKDGTFGIKEATITVYEGTLKENIKEIQQCNSYYKKIYTQIDIQSRNMFKSISINKFFIQKSVGKRFLDILGNTGWTDAGLVQYFYWDAINKKNVLKFKTYITEDKYNKLAQKWLSEKKEV